MNLKELSQLGLAYSMRSRAGVTAAFSKVAETSKIEFDAVQLAALSDELFWKFAQRLIDRVICSAADVIVEELKCLA